MDPIWRETMEKSRGFLGIIIHKYPLKKGLHRNFHRGTLGPGVHPTIPWFQSWSFWWFLFRPAGFWGLPIQLAVIPAWEIFLGFSDHQKLIKGRMTLNTVAWRQLFSEFFVYFFLGELIWGIRWFQSQQSCEYPPHSRLPVKDTWILWIIQRLDYSPTRMGLCI